MKRSIYTSTFLLLFYTLQTNLPAQTKDILPLGNSITFDVYNNDVRIDEDRISYRYRLYNLMNAAGYSFNFIGSENSGSNFFPDDENGGFPGIRDDQITHLLQTGFNQLNNVQETPGAYLVTYSPDIILLHIGTNGLDVDPGDVENILDEIDAFELSATTDVKVIVAEIINRQSYSHLTTEFNNNITQMISLRNDDDIYMVDMEFGAGIDYITDMRDILHPSQAGYDKMANVWFENIKHFFASPSVDPIIVTSAKDTAYVDHPYYYNVTATGENIIEYSLASSPSGMAIDSLTGIITWSPDSVGTYSIEVIVRSLNNNTDNQVFVLNVIEAPVIDYCQDETYNAPSGTISDNSGSENYINDLDCMKLIQPAGATSVELTFTSFSTEVNFDYVYVYDGATTGAPLLGSFTGNTLPPVLISSGPSMLVRFTSDGSVVDAGWEAEYTSNVGNGQCIDETFTEETGSFSDNGGTNDYTNNVDCRKLIQPAGIANISLTFTSFNVEQGYDFVYVYDGTTITDPLLGSFTGASLPPVISSTGGSMLVRFVSDYSVVAAGWEANYTSVIEGVCTNETFTENTGTIDDNSGTEDYFNNADCYKLIQPAGADSIKLNFTAFNTEPGNDVVFVYDGSTTSDPLIGSFSGNSIPLVLTAYSGSMLVRFISNGSVTAAGWNADYTSYGTYTGPCIDETFTEITGSFSDNGGTNDYTNNVDCRKLIQPAGVANISLTFTSFNVEQGYDFVYVYDGTTITDPLLGSFTGASLPPVLTSTGGSMLVRFVSDYSVVAAGWEANYTSVIEGVCTNETFTENTGTIDDNSGTEDYFNNADCYKLIQPAGADSIKLNFTAFNTEPVNDVVFVYDGSTTSDLLIGSFSGNSIPAVLTAYNGSMLIRFVSNGSITAFGWTADYVSYGDYTGPCIDETFTEVTGSLSDNGGINDYTNNVDCRKLIQPAGAANITLTFTSFNVEQGYDFVYVYDGNTTSDPLLGSFTGASLPPVLISTGGSMLVRFVSDYSVVAPGWEAEYISGDEYNGPCINEVFSSAGGTINDNSGSFNYFNNMDCEKLIQPAGASSITLTFTEFDVESGYDFIRVYDGATTGSTLLGTYSGSTLPPVLTSSGSSMLITFTSDYSVTYEGWQADYTASIAPHFTESGSLNVTEVMAGVDNSDEEFKISIYPNPTEGVLFIELNNRDLKDMIFELINSNGSTVLINTLSASEGMAIVDMSGLRNGVYILRILNNEFLQTFRVVLLQP